MALNITPKAQSTTTTTNSVSSQTPRPSVTFGKPTSTTARVEGLKAKLMNQPPPNTVAPRPAGSTARAEQYAKLQSYTPQPQQVTQTYQQPMQNIEPPPQQVQQVTQPAVAQLDNNVESPKPGPEASRELEDARFAAFERQERAMRKARQELEREKAQWKAEQASLREKLQANPLQFLSENGITYDKLVELQLNQPNVDPNQELIEKRLRDIENSTMQKLEERLTEKAQAERQAAVQQFRSDVNFLVDSDPAFETIKTLGYQDEVVSLIEKAFDQEGSLLTVEEACNLVESKLVEKKQKEIESLANLSKFKQRLVKPAEPRAEATNQVTTLSNQVSVNRPLTPRERAILAVEQANQRARNKV
jgi:hypothetical protein